ncbi:MAG: glycosyltransferase family 2 protein [Chloroflexota bacterium]|nr:glycosyltransferase family 2 protein [Chloroflexota bacterium]
MPQRVSVVITTYNYGRFIAGAIESVLAQTHPPDEVIVVDDGSTDDTRARVAAYAAQGVRYLWQANRGISAARNTGIRAGQGDLLAFLDSDDRWLPDKLARQLDHLARFPSVGLITGSEWQVYESGQRAYYVRRKPVGAVMYYPQILIENSIGNASLLLIRRACFDRVGLFNEKVGLGQDWDMWIRITRAFPIGVVAGPLIHFTRHADSISAGKVWQRYASNRVFHHRYIRRVPSRRLRLRLLCAAQSMNCYYTAATLVSDPAQRRVATALAAAALLLDPLYMNRQKLGVLIRAACGQRAFDRLRAGLRRGA